MMRRKTETSLSGELKAARRRTRRTQTLERAALLLAAAMILGSGAASAAGIVVGSGSALSMGDGQLSLGCGDLTIASGGSVAGDAGIISMGGTWSNAGSFSPGTSLVEFSDQCAPTAAQIQGSNSFYDFFGSTSTGFTLQIQSGSTQTFAHSLELQGGPGGLLTLRSSSPGSEAYFDLTPGGSQLISYVDVADNHATGQPLGPGPAALFNSVKSTNSNGWFETVTSIPTAGLLGLALLGLLLITAALIRLRAVG